MLSGAASNSPRYRTSPFLPSSAIATAFRAFAASIPTYASLWPPSPSSSKEARA
jgi:hypothetical protein